MKISILALGFCGLVGMSLPGLSADNVPDGPAWRRAPTAVGQYLGSQDHGVRWERPDTKGLEGEAEPGELERPTTALADSKSATLGKYCSTDDAHNTCSTGNVKKCSTESSTGFCSTKQWYTCSTTAEAGHTCTAFGMGKCSTSDFICSAKGEGKCSAEGNAECSATGTGFCSVKKGDGGTCTSLDGKGKCSAGMGGTKCSSWDNNGAITPPGADGTCSG